MIELADFGKDLCEGLGALNRPRRVSVSVGASENLVLSDAGGYSGPWSADSVPYMVEPMNCLASRHHSATCFVGPARTGKTAGLILGWLAHTVVNDIGRMMIMHMTEKKAAMLSKLDVDPAIEASENLRRLKSPRSHDNNIGLKIFKHGMAVRFSHPSRSELAGTTYRYVALTDFDRFPTSNGMGGNIFDSAMKRTETLMSRGMTLVESSPEQKMEDPHWKPSTKHEAPPCGGILGIYNRSDRRRWYWPCPDCGEYFEAAPGMALFATLPSETELLEVVRSADLSELAKRHAHIVCPCCGVIIGQEHKYSMNQRGRWVGDGQTITQEGEVIGDRHGSSIAGFWLGGVAAAYQTWNSLVTKYLQGLRDYALTGMEESLEASTYVDQGMPYMPRHLVEIAENGHQSQAEDLRRYYVPAETRFLVATVDVQGGTKGRFVVQIHAVGKHLEQWIVDRYSITKSPRGENIQIDPAGYLEDWNALTDRVINSTYKIDDERELRVLMTAVDSGGEAGVSHNAYAWYQSLIGQGLSHKVMLVKGGSSKPETPVVRANARDTRGKALKNVPLYMVDTDLFKDQIAAARRRKTPGPSYMHFPEWLPASFYEELDAEIRDKNGKWKKIRSRNESLDLWVYVLAVCWHIGCIQSPSRKEFNWDNPPSWADIIDRNRNVVSPDERREYKAASQVINKTQQNQSASRGNDLLSRIRSRHAAR